MAGKPQRGKAEERREGTQESRRRALELRKAGHTYESIARVLGYSGEGAAYRLVAAALAGITKEPAAEVLAIETERLNRMHQRLEKPARTGCPKAITTQVRVAERRARLLGLDAAPPVDLRTLLAGMSLADRKAWLERQASVIASLLGELA